MISIYAINKRRSSTSGELINVELMGLSTDDKPTELGDSLIDNGSMFVEMDTQKLFFYDLENEEWIGE